VIGSYYFWKWADNDLPGRFPEVHAALLRGEMPPALQTFDAGPLIEALEETARCDGWGERSEWHWAVTPEGMPEQARFVFVTCPVINDSRERLDWFYERFLPLKLSGIDEEGLHNIPCLRPKLNQFIPLQFPEESAYDIGEDDLPALLRMIVPGWGDASAEFLDRNRGVVAFAERRRFQVEWRENPDWSEPGKFEQWRAQDLKRLAALTEKERQADLPYGRDPDNLLFADALRIFRALLRGEPRPTRYGWKKLAISTL